MGRRRSPAARRLLTISERPMRVRSAGTAMAAGGARSGGGSFVTNRTRTWREGSLSIAATADGMRARRCWCRRGGGGGTGRRRVLAFWEFERWVYLVRVSEVVASLVPMFSERGGDGRMVNRQLGIGSSGMPFCIKRPLSTFNLRAPLDSIIGKG